MTGQHQPLHLLPRLLSSLSSAVHNLYSPSDPSVGLVDRLLNCREVKEAPNIVTLHVTSFPYALQTQHTLISPYNEIHWPASYSTVSAGCGPGRGDLGLGGRLFSKGLD